MEIFLYKCTSTFSALNNCRGILFKSHSYIYEVVRTNLSADFWTFRNFRLQFGENCGTTWGRKSELSSHSERAIQSEKEQCKQHQNRPKNHDTILVQTMSPQTNSAPADWSVTGRQTDKQMFKTKCSRPRPSFLSSRRLETKTLVSRTTSLVEIGQNVRPCGATFNQKVEILPFWGPCSHLRAPIGVKFCTVKRTYMPVGLAKFDVNRCNESPLLGENADFWPLSKQYRQMPLRGSPAGNKVSHR